MKLNIFGVIGGILTFVSIALPWWTMIITPWWMVVAPMEVSGTEANYSAELTVWIYKAKLSYLYGTINLTALTTGSEFTPWGDMWYGWIALTLLVISGVLAIIGSVGVLEKIGSVGVLEKILLLGGGALTLIAVIVFVGGLIGQLAKGIRSGWPTVGLFSNISYMGATYSTYLTYGFWLALVAMILMFGALIIKPREIATQTPHAKT